MYQPTLADSNPLFSQSLPIKQFSSDPWEYNMNAYGAYDDLMLLQLEQSDDEVSVDVPSVDNDSVDDDKNSVDMDVESDDELQALMVNCAVYKDHPMCAGFDFELEDLHSYFKGRRLQNLNFLTKAKKGMKKVGKSLTKIEKVAKKGNKLVKKASPYADQAWAIAAPKNHDKYAPKIAKGYKTFNEKANKMGGWGTVEKAADALQSVGLIMLDNEEVCRALNNEVHMNLDRFNSDFEYKFRIQSQIEKLGC